MKTRRKAARLASLSFMLLFTLCAYDGSPSAHPDVSPSVLGETIESTRPCNRYTLIGAVRVPVTTALERPHRVRPCSGGSLA